LHLCGCEWPQAAGNAAWDKDWKRINGLPLLLRGRGEVAELYVKKAMARFSKNGIRHVGDACSQHGADMARKVLILAEWEAIGRGRARLAYHRPRSCWNGVKCTSASEKT